LDEIDAGARRVGGKADERVERRRIVAEQPPVSYEVEDRRR
jgi:hypothetical protein